jgi:hypothetical protein
MVAYIESPLDRIVAVHFGGGFVIAEVNAHYMYLASLTPPDPDLLLTEQDMYEKGDTIPETDYRLTLTTTAILILGSVLITGIADTSIPGGPRLGVDGIYPISGEGIPGGATMTYTGETVAGLGHGTLSVPATINASASQIRISMNWLFQPRSLSAEDATLEYQTLMDTSTETPLGYNLAYGYDGSTTNRTHTDVFYDAGGEHSVIFYGSIATYIHPSCFIRDNC